MASSFQQQREEARRWLFNATQLDASKQYVEAEECYTRGILLLRDTVRDPALPQAEQQQLMNYISDVAKRVQVMREVNRATQRARASAATSSSPPQQQQQQQRPPAANVSTAGRKTGGGGDDYLAFLDDPKYQTILKSEIGASHSNPSPPPRTNDSSSPSPSQGSGAGPKRPPTALPPPLPSDFLATPDLTARPSSAAAKDIDGAPPPVNKVLREHFAPRTSDFVLKAIDIAKQLTQQEELKRAVDVLQHAYKVGCRERNNPSNFGLIKETLHFMRQRYYAHHPPRFLQDNAILPPEMTVLRKSGITSTILLPMWDDVSEGYGAENVFMPSEGVWEDSFTPQLDAAQVKQGAKFLHVADLFGGRLDSLAIVRQADPMSIRQSVVGDCSMVCSLIICASFQKRFPKARIISNVIYPQDKHGNPFVNPKGKYCVKMLINGMTRIVTIDDRLPANPRNKQLLCTQNSDATELWVSLMEKAFVKVCGGSYNFPGSTSSSDLYKLSGWLPDSLKLHDVDTDPDFQWRRLCNSFAVGAVLVSIMTDNEVPKAVQDKTNLPPGHAFAVLNLREMEVEGKKLRVVQIRNPWSRQTWNGTLSIKDTSAIAKTVHEAFEYSAEAADLGVFLMLWEDALHFFDRLSLSWNPYMLFRGAEGQPRRPTRLACHSTFDYTTAIGEMPQVHIGVVAAPRRTRMHLVFSRHIQDVTEFSLQYEKDDPTVPFVGLQVFDVTSAPSVAQCIGGKCIFGMCYGRRLFCRSDFAVHMESLNEPVYRNLSAFTVSFDCPPGTSDLLVVVNRTESSVHKPFNFSLTLHTELEQMRLPTSSALAPSESLTDFNNQLETANTDKGNPDSGVFMHLVPGTSLKYTSTTRGSWVKGKTCGGRSDASTLVYNPQFKLTLTKPALISAKLTVTDTTESCQLLVCRKKSHSTGGPNEKPLSFAARVGSQAADAELVMSAKLYGIGGCCVDSAIPDTLAYDPCKILGTRKKRVTRKIKVSVADSADGKASVSARGADSFTMYDIDDSDEVATIVLAALDQGYPASLATAEIVAGGKKVSLTSPLKSFFESGADDLPASVSPSEAQVRLLLNNAEVAQLFPLPKGSAEAELFQDIKAVLRLLQTRASQVRSYQFKFINYIRRINTAEPPVGPPCLKAYLIGLCNAGIDCVKREVARTERQSATVSRAPECLPPLPAGDYTLIPSLWRKGVPGKFTLTVETTEPHTLSEIPEEGAGLTEKIVSAQLIPKGTAIPGRLDAKLVLPKSDTYFLNSKTSIQLAARGVFTCRLLLLEDAEDVERTGKSSARTTFANVSLFRVRDASMMEMMATSGNYTSVGGIAIPPTTLDAQTQYLAVVSATESSNSKYVLRMYSSTAFSAQLVQ